MNQMEEMLWTAQTLFDRGDTTGTTGNISLYENGCMYISSSGGCFGKLSKESLCQMDLDGKIKNDAIPSKEWPLHAMLHRMRSTNGVVIHTHGCYTVAWSCLPCEKPQNAIPAYTPYLRMKGGPVRFVPYAPPGTSQLFEAFSKALSPESQVYLLAHHGCFVTAATAMEAFNLIEETENAAHLAIMFQNKNIPEVI